MQILDYCKNPWHTSKSRRRMIAIEMYDDGHQPDAIAAALKLGRSAVNNVLAASGRTVHYTEAGR